jgi:hypothetical protein
MDETTTERDECGCVSQARRWQVPGWDCFSVKTLVSCGSHVGTPARRPVPEDWEAALLASIPRTS